MEKPKRSKKDEYLKEYKPLRDLYGDYSSTVRFLLENLLRTNGFKYQAVTNREKSEESLRTKLATLKKIKSVLHKWNISPIFRKYKFRILYPFKPIFKISLSYIRKYFGEDPKFIQPYIYAGNNVICFCCGWKGEKFLPYGELYDGNCPNCGSHGRARLVYLFLESKITLPAVSVT